MTQLSSPVNAAPPRFYIVNQHIGWLKQYILGMDEKNWRDMLLRAERQLESLSEEIDKEEAALSRHAQSALPPLVDRAELIALLEDLASVNLSPEACARQARRMADDLIARGLSLTSPERKAPKSCPQCFDETDCSHVDICNAVEEAYAAQADAPAALPQRMLEAAAEHVCWFDWSNNDTDAVDAIEGLRKALAHTRPDDPHQEVSKS